MIFRFYGLFFISLLSLFASDIAKYQEIGIEAIEKEFDARLASKAYWEDALGDKNLTLGYYSSFNRLLLCDKNNSTLRLYKVKNGHTLQKETTYSAFTGKVSGDKQTEGDLKTPLGVYTLTQKLNHVDPFYGPLALVTNYPNSYDKARDKTGHGIWIHGLPLQGSRDTFTQGCIAIENTALSHLAHDINVSQTAVLIATNTIPTTNKDEISTILSALFKWRNAWKANDFETYASFYDTNFLHQKYDSRTSFLHFKKHIFNNKSHKRISLHHVNVIPYPNLQHEKLFLLEMKENYHTKYVHFDGTKQLYIKLNKTSFTILTEH